MNNAGLPGTGLGGLLYIMLALVMPLHELRESLQGRSSTPRRWLALRQAAFALGIIGTVIATWWLLLEFSIAPNPFRLDDDWSLMAVVVAAPALLLATLVTVIRVWAWVAKRGAVVSEHRAVEGQPSSGACPAAQPVRRETPLDAG